MRTSRPSERGQSTVELAVILPLVVLLVLVAIQASLVMRDRVLLVNATRAAARAAIVSPTVAAARTALQQQGHPLDSATVSLTGDTQPGGLVTVRAEMKPTALPVVGRVVSRIVLREQLTVLVEGVR